MNQNYARQAQDINNPKNDMGATAKFSPTFVQFIFNMGFLWRITELLLTKEFFIGGALELAKSLGVKHGRFPIPC